MDAEGLFLLAPVQFPQGPTRPLLTAWFLKLDRKKNLMSLTNDMARRKRKVARTPNYHRARSSLFIPPPPLSGSLFVLPPPRAPPAVFVPRRQPVPMVVDFRGGQGGQFWHPGDVRESLRTAVPIYHTYMSGAGAAAAA